MSSGGAGRAPFGSRCLASSREAGGDRARAEFFFLANLFFNPIPVLGNQYNQALTATAGAERIFHLLDTPPEWTDAADARELPPLLGRVEFRNVSLAYEPTKPVLHGVSFTVDAGQTVALVGSTGSGKTSIIHLLAKLYLPSAGQIVIDGTDIAGVTGASLHRQMGSVLQNNFIFTGTVLENIRVGRPGASEVDAEISRTRRGPPRPR